MGRYKKSLKSMFKAQMGILDYIPVIRKACNNSTPEIALSFLRG
jgi:hypothetical protein